MSPAALQRRSHWVFDLDGTLTVPQHDFDAMRAELGLPAGLDLLSGLGTLPASEQARGLARIAEWEWELADRARARPGAADLVATLLSRGARLGVLTRNQRDVALRTLRAIGLDHAFDGVVGRGEAQPKPAPDGVTWWLRHWGVTPSHGVMVGDHPMDARAGRAAGVATVLLADPPVACEAADLVVPTLEALG